MKLSFLPGDLHLSKNADGHFRFARRRIPIRQGECQMRNAVLLLVLILGSCFSYAQGDSPRPLTPELAKLHPWVNSIALVEVIRGESLVPETADLLKLFQEDAAKKGLGRVRRIQSTQPGPRFVGAWFTYRGSGLYRMDVYQEMPVDGKLQYNGLGELQKARVAPTEVIEISGHNYTHTVNGTEIKGTF
jgi:hypothetical protein